MIICKGGAGWQARAKACYNPGMFRFHQHPPGRGPSALHLFLVMFLMVLCAPAVRGQPDTLRVMPLGDSITEAQGGVSETQPGFAGYRYWLWKDLESEGHPVDFVGSQHGVWNGPPPYTDYDQDHEGHWGWRADQILVEIGAWAAAALPDMVLIHLGHNDIWQGESVSSTVDELGQIIDAIRGANPAATFLLAQVIPALPAGLDSIPALNDQIAILGAVKNTAASPVLLVDQHTGFDPWTDTYDSVHPNESGEQKMAGRWFAPLDSIFTHLSHVSSVPASAAHDLQLANFPNPFNPATTITFDLPRPDRISLRIFDVAGRRVRALLVDQERGEGRQQFVWRGRDDAGRLVGAGVYFYRVETGDFSETGRMTLVK